MEAAPEINIENKHVFGVINVNFQTLLCDGVDFPMAVAAFLVDI